MHPVFAIPPSPASTLGAYRTLAEVRMVDPVQEAQAIAIAFFEAIRNYEAGKKPKGFFRDKTPSSSELEALREAVRTQYDRAMAFLRSSSSLPDGSKDLLVMAIYKADLQRVSLDDFNELVVKGKVQSVQQFCFHESWIPISIEVSCC